MAKIGHNSGDTLNGSAQKVLRDGIARIERLEEEKAEIAEQIKEVYTEIKGQGFDTKAIRRLVRARKRDRARAQEERQIIELYALALGDETLADLV